MTNILEIRNLCVEVGGHEVLHDLELAIPDGEVHALVGPNGSGKTTLMMTICGYSEYVVTRGRILFNGQDMAELGITERAKLGIGVSQQRPPTITGVKLRQILDFVTVDDPQRAREIDELARALQMESFLERDVNAGLSGGEIKRCELFQLLITHPRFVMMDEPDSGVDLEAMSIVGKMTNELLARNHATRPMERRAGLVITHTGNILDHVHADKAHVMIEGGIGCSGNPRILLDQIRECGYEECIRCELREHRK